MPPSAECSIYLNTIFDNNLAPVSATRNDIRS